MEELQKRGRAGVRVGTEVDDRAAESELSGGRNAGTEAGYNDTGKVPAPCEVRVQRFRRERPRHGSGRDEGTHCGRELTESAKASFLLALLLFRTLFRLLEA